MAEIPRWQTPISRWCLDGNANDLYGLHNGTPTNITYSTDAKEKGLSGSFNGSSSVINCGNWSFFSYTNISISLWFKVTGTHDSLLTCTRPGYDFPRVQFILDSAGYLNYTIVNNSGSVLFSQGGPMSNDGVWHHICVTDANGTVSSYLDGSPTTPSGSYSRSNLSNLTTVNMGIMVLAANQRPFAGLMDDVRFYDVALTADEVMNLYKSYAIPIWQQPLHHWKLDGNANDSAGNKNGTEEGNYAYTRFPSIIGKSITFSGGSTTWVKPPFFKLSSYTNFSVSGWVNTTSTNRICILSQADASSNSWRINIALAGYFEYIVTGTAVTLVAKTSSKLYNDGKWHHFVLTDANGTYLSYVDGIAIDVSGSYTRSGTMNSNNNTIGGLDNNETPNPYGSIQDVRFYDVALSAADIKALYNSYFTEKAINFISSMV